MFRRFPGTLALLLAAALNACSLNAQSPQVQGRAATASQNFHGTYEELNPAQKKLIDEWYADYNKLTHDNSKPTEYNQFSISTRTTFEAVTHALMTTRLTDKSGRSMGNALDLVEAIEAINGKVPRARGDLQFRVYVVLKPDALEKLKASNEFFRDRDNTVFHHGYPLNYRQNGATPTIQVSMAKDSRHADIDVDYRSAKFPQGLVNGHLTAANSDVRAQGNTQKHLQRWQGLIDWWQNMFGFLNQEAPSDETVAEGEIPPIPRKGSDRVEIAAADYLTSWRVEQKPNLSAAYLSSTSYSCLAEYGPESGRVASGGVAPYLAANEMAQMNRGMGKVNALQDAAEPLRLNDQNLKPVKHRYQSAFSLYQVSNGQAAEYICDPERAFDYFDKMRAEESMSRYGSFFASVFRLKGPNPMREAVTLLWTKEGKYWKVIAWDVEPEEAVLGKEPDMRRRRAAARAAASGPDSAAEPNIAETNTAEAKVVKTNIKADPGFVHAAHDFLYSWVVADNIDHAATYFSEQSNKCVLDYVAPDKPAPSTSADYAAYLRNAMATIGKDVAGVKNLRDAMEPVQPEYDDLKVLPQEGEDAYTVVAVPDDLSELFLCEQESAKHPFTLLRDPKHNGYGDYYATIFSLRTPGEHAAALSLLWAREGTEWKIIAYEMLAP